MTSLFGRFLGIIAVLMLALASSVTMAWAVCECGCTNGVPKMICQRPTDERVVCGVAACQGKMPATPAHPSTAVPPANTAGCRLAQTYNPYTTQYQWRQVCP